MSRTAYEAVLAKLLAVEASLVVKESEFVDESDVHALTESSSPPAVSFAGLARLEAAIVSVLNELQSVQETVYSQLRADVQRSTEFYSVSSPLWRSILQLGDATSSSPSSSSSVLKSNRRRAELVCKSLMKQLQDIHDGTTTCLDVKVQAFESVTFCMETYARTLAALVEETRGKSKVHKVARLIQPRLQALLIHPSLREHEACSIAADARRIWDAAFFQSSNESYAERKLLQNSVVVKQSSVIFLKMGAGAVLTLWALSECFNNELVNHKRIWFDPTFAIFMCFGDLLLLLWMWGLSMQVWRAAGIDFVGLLNLEKTEVDGRRAPELVVYTAATDLTLMFLSVFICFNKAARGVFSLPGSLAVAHALSVLMVAYFVYRIISPWSDSRRKWLWFLWQVVSAPFYPVGFRDGYIGDLLTSLVRVLIPMSFSFAYLFVSVLAWLTDNMSLAASSSDVWWQDSAFFRLFLVPFLTLFPLWIRLMQCLRRSVETGKRWPHMANALKYTSAIVVISLGTLRPSVRQNPLWVLGFVLATLYQFAWDLAMDWGIVVPASSPGASSLAWGGLALRRVRLLGGLGVYTAVISANLLLRFAWTLTLLPTNVGDTTSLYSVVMAYLGPLIAAAEILRRMVWGFFRLEHEQLEVIGAVGAAASTSALGGAHKKRDHDEDIGLDLDDEDEELDEEQISLAPVEFERMGLSAAGGRSSQTWDPVAAFTSSVFSARGIPACFERDWLPLPELVVVFAARFSWLDRHASLAAKNRLLEAEIFAAVVLGFIILVAAGA